MKSSTVIFIQTRAPGGLIVAGVGVQVILSTQRLLTPVDVGGTLLGGAMSTVEHVAPWMLAIAGVLLAALLRLPGFRLAWITAGAAPILLGTLTLWSYPDDFGGNLNFSPQRSEIAVIMALAVAFLGLGLMLCRYVRLPRASGRQLRPLLNMVRWLAMFGMAVVFIALPILR